MKIGVVIMLTELAEIGRVARYSEIRDIAQAVEAAGFDLQISPYTPAALGRLAESLRLYRASSLIL